MNRAERRRNQKQKDPVYNLKQSDIDKIKKDASNEAIDKAFIIMCSLPCMVLRDKYGFGEKRMKQFMDHLMELYDSFNTGYVTFEDLLTTLKEEVGVTFEFKKG